MVAKILIVDDESSSLIRLISQNFDEQIRQHQYEFSYAPDGQKAWEIIQLSCPDLLLADIRMPRLDGLALLNRINQHHLNIKTIVITAYGTIENIKIAMRERVFDFLMKPLNRQELKDSVARVLAIEEEKMSGPKPLSSRPHKIHFHTVSKLARELPPSQQYKLVCNLVETFPLDQIEELQEELPSLRILAQEEELEREQVEREDIQRITRGLIPLRLLEEGYIEERTQKYRLVSGEETEYRYLYVRWLEPETKRLRGRSLRQKDLQDPKVRQIIEKKLGKPLEQKD